MAKQTIRYEQKQRARLSPTFVLWVNIVLGVATILACWYAFLYRPQIAYQVEWRFNHYLHHCCGDHSFYLGDLVPIESHESV